MPSTGRSASSTPHDATATSRSSSARPAACSSSRPPTPPALTASGRPARPSATAWPEPGPSTPRSSTSCPASSTTTPPASPSPSSLLDSAAPARRIAKIGRLRYSIKPENHSRGPRRPGGPWALRMVPEGPGRPTASVAFASRKPVASPPHVRRRKPPGIAQPHGQLHYGNLLLGLVAIVAVATTLFALASLFWVTRKRRGLPDFTPPVTIYKPLKGIDEGLEENLRSFFRLDYPTYQLLFCVADADDPAIPLVERLLARVPRPRRPADRRLPGLRAQPEGREPGGDGAAPQARHDPDQRLQRPGPPVLPPRDGLLPGRPGRRAWSRTCSRASARSTRARRWRTCSSTGSSPGAWRRRRSWGSPAWSASRC